jgi:hypothetical protein
MEDKAFKKVYFLIKNKLQEEMMASGAPTNSTNPPGQVNIAGLPPDNPPVDLRKRKERKWNPFFKDLAKIQRRKNK